mmetsp:Transcript_60755/g.162443  ORF Transcript_60755/g.162443 Transcript_60755/m.162443 type:complete len:103 (+) Transcript_60755:1758-2066(+)
MEVDFSLPRVVSLQQLHLRGIWAMSIMRRFSLDKMRDLFIVHLRSLKTEWMVHQRFLCRTLISVSTCGWSMPVYAVKLECDADFNVFVTMYSGCFDVFKDQN